VARFTGDREAGPLPCALEESAGAQRVEREARRQLDKMDCEALAECSDLVEIAAEQLFDPTSRCPCVIVLGSLAEKRNAGGVDAAQRS
jgi:hypothetical protein